MLSDNIFYYSLFQFYHDEVSLKIHLIKSYIFNQSEKFEVRFTPECYHETQKKKKCYHETCKRKLMNMLKVRNLLTIKWCIWTNNRKVHDK